MEGATEVTRQVGAILEAPGPHRVPAALAEVARFQAAARRILEAYLDAADEQRLLFKLYRVAKDTAEWVEGAIRAIDWELAEAADVAPAPNAGWVARQGRMRAAGFASCPQCGGHIATDEELRRYLRLAREGVR